MNSFSICMAMVTILKIGEANYLVFLTWVCSQCKWILFSIIPALPTICYRSCNRKLITLVFM